MQGFKRLASTRLYIWILAICIVAAGTLTATRVAAQVSSGGSGYQGITPTYSNLRYANASSSEVLDLFLPSGTGSHPVVVFIHGGAFASGDKDTLNSTTAQALLKAGYAIASINYRLSSESKYPTQIEDAKAAVRFLRANAARYNLNTNEFAAWGVSAGAYIAQMLADTAGVKALEGAQLGNATYSSRVQAVINQSGPSDFLKMDAELTAQGCTASAITHDQATSPESVYLGVQITHVPLLVRVADPLTYIKAGSPPTLVEARSADCAVPVQQSTLLYNALKKAGVQTQYVLLQGPGSGNAQFNSTANITRIVSFLKTALR